MTIAPGMKKYFMMATALGFILLVADLWNAVVFGLSVGGAGPFIYGGIALASGVLLVIAAFFWINRAANPLFKPLVFTILGFLLTPLKPLLPLVSWAQRTCDRSLKWFVKTVYAPTLELALDNRASVLAIAAGLDAVLEQRTHQRVTVFRPLFEIGRAHV